MHNPVWNRMTLAEIQERTSGLPVPVELTPDGSAIMLPNNRRGLREVLKVLNRNIGREILTDEFVYYGTGTRLEGA
jgi:hypothetical protein